MSQYSEEIARLEKELEAESNKRNGNKKAVKLSIELDHLRSMEREEEREKNKSRYSENQKRWTMDYIKNNLDEIKIRVPKGKKDEYKKFAESRGTSLTKMIIDLLEKEIQNS